MKKRVCHTCSKDKWAKFFKGVEASAKQNLCKPCRKRAGLGDKKKIKKAFFRKVVDTPPKEQKRSHQASKKKGKGRKHEE